MHTYVHTYIPIQSHVSFCCLKKKGATFNFFLVVVHFVGFLFILILPHHLIEKEKKKCWNQNTKSFVTTNEIILFVGSKIAPIKVGTAKTVLQWLASTCLVIEL